LLAAQLRQNPRFQAGMSGPQAGLFGALLGQMNARNEYSVFIDDTQRERIVHGLFDNFYADSPAEVIFDTSRGGCEWMPAVANGVVAPDGMAGGPYDALKQACFGAQRDRLLLVQYETLTVDPGATMLGTVKADFDCAEFDMNDPSDCG